MIKERNARPEQRWALQLVEKLNGMTLLKYAVIKGCIYLMTRAWENLSS